MSYVSQNLVCFTTEWHNNDKITKIGSTNIANLMWVFWIHVFECQVIVEIFLKPRLQNDTTDW